VIVIRINGKVYTGMRFPTGRPRKCEESYLIVIPWSNACYHVAVVLGFCSQDALDGLVDNGLAHWIEIEGEEDIKEAEEGGWVSYQGNEGTPCCLDRVAVLDRVVSIDYFAKDVD
jgi:hypothetical protein